MRRTCGGTIAALLAISALAACETHTFRSVDRSMPRQVATPIAEELLFDVGVAVLDSNVPKSYDDQIALNIPPEVRRAEANFIPFQLKNLLTSTGNWGAVRVLPRPSLAVDVVIAGRILHSDGERLVLQVSVSDARGILWFDRVYESLASKFAYQSGVPSGIDPFQGMYVRIADDMLAHSETLTVEEREDIRLTTLMRFARYFLPDAFSTHLSESADGEFNVTRVASEDDPSLARVREVREREYIFIDTLDEYYGRFAEDMIGPYQHWRSNTFSEAIMYRQQREFARTRLIASTAMILSGAVMQRSANQWIELAGYTNVVGGADEFVRSFKSREAAKIHSETLIELGVSAEAEIIPHTIELENEVLTLTGTVEEQYAQVRTVLRRLYFEDLGLPMSEDESTEPEAASVSDDGQE